MFLNGFPNKEKHSASSMVDLPAPFSPIINVVGDLSKNTSTGLFPVDKKFVHLIFLKCINYPHLIILVLVEIFHFLF